VRARGPTQLTADGITAALRASAPLEQLSVDGFEQRSDGYDQRGADEDLRMLLSLVRDSDPERLDVVLCGSEGYTAVWTRATGEEGNRTVSWFHDLQEDEEVADYARCHRLQTRDEAALAVQCQGCKMACCAHAGPMGIYECGCKQFMCEACREDCHANDY
jgi:hypothetical protein